MRIINVEPFLSHSQCESLAGMCEKLLLVIFCDVCWCERYSSTLFSPFVFIGEHVCVCSACDTVSCVPFRCKWCLLLWLLLPLLFNVKLLRSYINKVQKWSTNMISSKAFLAVLLLLQIER